MVALQTPRAEHLEFDQLCQELDDFEPLPGRSDELMPSVEDVEEEPFDGLILAGLVSPV